MNVSQKNKIVVVSCISCGSFTPPFLRKRHVGVFDPVWTKAICKNRCVVCLVPQKTCFLSNLDLPMNLWVFPATHAQHDISLPGVVKSTLRCCFPQDGSDDIHAGMAWDRFRIAEPVPDLTNLGCFCVTKKNKQLILWLVERKQACSDNWWWTARDNSVLLSQSAWVHYQAWHSWAHTAKDHNIFFVMHKKVQIHL